jgi:hypothetical protein
MLKHFLTAVAILVLATATVWFALPPKARESERLENPPPKPPNCEAMPKELFYESGEALPEGIRIIRVGETRLFVPVKWIENYFVDSQSTRPDRHTYDILKKFRPDLHGYECPGVEHTLVAIGQTPRFGKNRGDVVAFVLRGNFAPKQVKGTDRIRGFSVSIQATKRPDGSVKTYPRYSSTGNYWVQPSPDFFLTKVGCETAAVKKYEEELHKLGKWLMTHPRYRDNSHEFFPPSEF